MFLAHAVAMQMQSLNDLKAHYKLEEDVWGAFTDCAGDPGQDIRLLAVLPAAVLTASLQRAQLPDGRRLIAIQAAHVGLVYNLARRILHVRDGGTMGVLDRGEPVWRPGTSTKHHSTKFGGDTNLGKEAEGVTGVVSQVLGHRCWTRATMASSAWRRRTLVQTG